MLFTCIHCGKSLKVPPSLLGRSGRCPHCKKVLDFPQAQKETGLEDAKAKKRTLRRTLEQTVSLLLALIVHALLVLIIALFSGGPEGAGSPGHTVGLGEGLPGSQLTNVHEGNFEAQPVVGAAAPDDFSAPVELAPATDLNDSDPIAIPALVPSGGGNADGTANPLEMLSIGGRSGGGSGGDANFMGTSAKGNRFCIIADRSGSMGGPKMEFVKAEIIKTLSELRPGAKFNVIMFDDVAEPMPGGPWMEGRKDAPRVTPWLRSINARGGTEPYPAFQVALRLNPKPDVIFFMTDGLFSGDVPARVAQLNTPGSNGKRVTIHTIAFHDRSGEALLKQIAEQSGGKYRYVPGVP
jgi:hypothetical protein